MKKNYLKLQIEALAFLILSIALPIGLRADASVVQHGPSVILIIRHAEKPDETDGVKDPNLSPLGYKRADALAVVLPAHFPKPDFLFATRKSKGSVRPIETITPLSKALKEQIDSTFKDDEFGDLAHEVMTNPKYDGKVVLIAWHHGKIPQLAQALGVKAVPEKWSPEIFDRVWEIDYTNGAATWKNLPEKALPGDEQQ